MDSRFDSALKKAMTQAAGAGDISKLKQESRTLVLVHAAQGLIDNGGLQYFFEADFPANPSYEMFVEAYVAIGAKEAAANLARAVALFPFKNPHLHMKRRNDFLDSFKDEEGDAIDSPFEPLTRALYGNKQVWQCLERYVEQHRTALGD